LPAVPINEALPSTGDLQEAYADQAPSDPLCDDPLLAAEFSLDDVELPILYVDVEASADVADGSSLSPLTSIGEAVELASGPSVIAVAIGEYDEALTIANGIHLLGGFDPSAWQRPDAGRTILRGETLAFDGFNGAEELSMLDGFEIHATTTLDNATRLWFRNNVIVPPLSPDPALEPNHTHRAESFSATGSVLRAEFNTLFVDAPETERVVSRGFSIRDSCARLTQNHLYDIKIPFPMSGSNDVVVAFNVVERGRSGVGFTASSGYAVGNYFQAVEPPFTGAAYVVTLNDGSRPTLRYNTFYLASWVNNGINEGSADSDPEELVGNTFQVIDSSTLYYDRDDDPDVDLRRIDDIDEVNALPDIPMVQDNVLLEGP
jgi:hypothetical protein